MQNLYHPSLAHDTYDAIVIGSGIGGLTTALFLAQAGKKVLVLEQHYVTGGFTHTFKRKQFSWDVGVHYIGQVHDPKSLLYKAFGYVTDGKLQWQNMGDVYDKAVIDGEEFLFKSGLNAQLDQLISYFPEEEAAIRAYYQLVISTGKKGIWFFSEKTMPLWLSKTAGYFLRKGFSKYARQTTFDVISRLTTNPKLIAVLCTQCGNYGLPPKKSSFAIHAMITEHFLEGGNYPVGGASSIHKNICANLEKHGGKIAVKAAVKEIIVKKNKAIGVLLENGNCLYARKIISNAGASATFGKLLKHHPELNPVTGIKPSTGHVCLYIALDKSDEELQLPKNNIWVYNSVEFDRDFESHLSETNSPSPLAYLSFPSAKDPDWATTHPGTATIQVIESYPFEWIEKWQDLQWQKRGEEYQQIKNRVSENLLNTLLEQVPQIKEHIVYQELSTPLSTQHFTGYPRGEIYGLEHSPDRFLCKTLRPKTSVKNLYLTGQDVVCVGVGSALFSGIITATAVLNRNVMMKVLRYKEKIEKLRN